MNMATTPGPTARTGHQQLAALGRMFSGWLSAGQMRDLGRIRPAFGEMASALDARAPELVLTPERAALLRAVYEQECARRGLQP